VEVVLRDVVSVRMKGPASIKGLPISVLSIASPIVRSALWAAWGDALGFPAELADERMLQRRLDGEPDGQLRPWARRIGGRMGPIVKLPAGCSSDDTQLRLAVGRCIRASGRFDVEAFSKIELPVFLSYELGGGRGTKAAAHALSRRTTRWFSNFFEARGARYVDGGGNGAAMRIQPHVWAARDARPDSYLVPLLRDVVCTHGHPRAMLGAALHALVLGTTLHQGAVPGPERWTGMVGYLTHVEELLRDDDVLRERWVPAWEHASGRPVGEAIAETVAELSSQVVHAAEAAEASAAADSGQEQRYGELARVLGGLNPRTRGAGTVSAVLALWLAWTFRSRPLDGLRVSAELLGSDTDTVATMAGALLGVVASEEPAGPLVDRDLIVTEALRLEALGRGERRDSFPHPDPLRWQPPSSLSDALGRLGDQPAVAGLGPAGPIGDPISGQGKQPGLWQWVLTDYGQHLLIKRRVELSELPETARPRARAAAPLNVEAALPVVSQLREPRPNLPGSSSSLPTDPEEGMALLVAAGMPDALLARMTRHYARQGVIQAAVFATLFSVALRGREDEALRDKRGGGPSVGQQRPGGRTGD
jgi:ADP-ribosylglycohydrolase